MVGQLSAPSKITKKKKTVDLAKFIRLTEVSKNAALKESIVLERKLGRAFIRLWDLVWVMLRWVV